MFSLKTNSQNPSALVLFQVSMGNVAGLGFEPAMMAEENKFSRQKPVDVLPYASSKQ